MTMIRTFSEGDDRFSVNGGTHELRFLGGNDRLILRGGETTAYLGEGNDFVRVESGLARLFGQAGDDRFEIFASNVRANGGGGNDTFVVAGGSNHVLVGRDGDDRFNITTSTYDLLVTGDEGNDRFYGNWQSIAGSLSGGAGNDSFFDFGNIGGRTVTLYGGPGNDTYRLDPASPPTIVEYAGEGIDTVQIAPGVNYTLGDNIENLVVIGTASGGTAMLGGNGLANRITGGPSRDVIDGGAGDDVLFGLAGDDEIFGGAGNDRITGGAGVDYVHGGEGADVFVYSSASDAPYDPTYSYYDWIVDYDEHDQIDVSGIDANALMPGHQSFTVVEGTGTTPGTLYYSLDSAGWGWITVLGYIDGDDVPDIQILITSYYDDWDYGGNPPVTPDDFIVG